LRIADCSTPIRERKSRPDRDFFGAPRDARAMADSVAKSRELSAENAAEACGWACQRARQNYSKRRISTGRMRDAERAGKSVAATLMNSAAAAIQIASDEFAWNGT
jgi:hypothetical protein